MKSEQQIRERLDFMRGREAGEQKQYIREALGQQIMALEWVLDIPNILSRLEEDT